MREWPPPRRSWILAQTWRDLLFAHWPVDAQKLARLVPPQFELDLWDGEAWIGVIPFRINRIRPRGMFAWPWLSATPEINVRTYVKFGGKRGIYFLSLDASNPAVVQVAKRFFHLSYFQATMKLRAAAETIHYDSLRGDARFRGSYSPAGDVAPPRPGTLAHWLTERYCFYALDKTGQVMRGEIDHPPWPLQAAEASIEVNSMTAPFGIDLDSTPPLLHFSRAIDVRMWLPERVIL